MFTMDVDYLISDCQHQDVKMSVLFNVAHNIWREEFEPIDIQMSLPDVRHTEGWLIFSASEGNVLPSGAPCHQSFASDHFLFYDRVVASREEDETREQRDMGGKEGVFSRPCRRCQS